MLNPIPGTYFENQPPVQAEDFIRTVAIFRFILPDTFIRLAAGRAFLPDNGKAALRAGANAVISGDFLTTTGITFETDIRMIKRTGIRNWNPDALKSFVVILDKIVYNERQKGFELHFSEVWDYVKSILEQNKSMD